MSLECQIELDKKGGIKITVIDADGNKSQTIEMDGSQLVLTVKDQSNTSTITQKPDQITIKCDKFMIDAKEITTKSSEATKMTADGTMDLTSTQNMTLKSSQDAEVSATANLNLKGQIVKAAGQAQAELSAPQVSVKADAAVSVEGATASVQGKTTCDVKGLMVSLKGDTVTQVEGLMTTVKGQLTNVNGTLVNLGS
jgi:hypothetical protein